MLVEFDPGHVPGLALIRMQDELSTLLGGRQVDLVTLKFLHPRIRQHVLAEMEVQYTQDLPPLIAALEKIVPPEEAE